MICRWDTLRNSQSYLLHLEVRRLQFFYIHHGCSSIGFYKSTMELRREEWEYNTSSYNVTNPIVLLEVPQFLLNKQLPQFLQVRLILQSLQKLTLKKFASVLFLLWRSKFIELFALPFLKSYLMMYF